VNVSFLDEPELEFGAGPHIDTRFGITNFGPLDIGSALAPTKIDVGIVGTPDEMDRTLTWIERCRDEIPAKASPHPNLAPLFPGFRPDAGFRSTLVLDSTLRRTVYPREFEALKAKNDYNLMIRESVRLFFSELEYLSTHTTAAVLLVVVPQQLAELLDPEARPQSAARDVLLDFHDMLKAEALDLRPIQLILPSTSDPARARKLKIRNQLRTVQDEATRAWNFHAALYYKAHGRPWRLTRRSSELKTCFVGVSFYRSLDRAQLLVSMAQVFDERGDGVVIRGGPVKISKEDRTPRLSEVDAATLLTEALSRYRSVHHHAPARIVMHKSSTFNAAEIAGFRAAASQEHIHTMDLLSVSEESTLRLFRYGSYPPLRGTLLSLDSRHHALYTRGSVNFFETYPGKYIPRPFLFRCESVEEAPRNLGQEILALTKMDWNRTRFDGTAPITVEAARRVGEILKYVPDGKRIADRYAHYM